MLSLAASLLKKTFLLLRREKVVQFSSEHGENMDKQNIEWLDYDILKNFPKIFSATFLRHGGISVENFSSLNSADAVGDHPDAVKVNRELLRKTSNMDQLVYLKQVHGTAIVEITKENALSHFEADGLITREKNIALVITHADCQAALFYDARQEIIGAFHVGWKGLVQNFYSIAVKALQNKGCQSKDLYVAISPSLGKDHAEFKDYKKTFPKEFWDFQDQDKPNYFDLTAIAKSQLKSLGLLDKNIEISDQCTYCHPEDFYSYRRDKITGRHATMIGLR
jgi:YfiH family protein